MRFLVDVLERRQGEMRYWPAGTQVRCQRSTTIECVDSQATGAREGYGEAQPKILISGSKNGTPLYHRSKWG